MSGVQSRWFQKEVPNLIIVHDVAVHSDMTTPLVNHPEYFFSLIVRAKPEVLSEKVNFKSQVSLLEHVSHL